MPVRHAFINTTLAILILVVFISPAAGQDAVRLSLDLGSDVEIVTRWGYTIRVDGRYRGHVSREALLLISRGDAGSPSRPADAGLSGSGAYHGELLVSEDSIRDGMTVARRIADRRDATVEYLPSGEVRAPEGQRAPIFRGVPSFPDKAVAPGDTWQAPGSVQFYLEDDRAVVIPVLAEYTYQGTEMYQDRRVHRVTAIYAVRGPLSRGQLGSHPARDIVAGLPQLPSDYTLHGRHDLDVLLPVGGGPPVFQRTTIREQLRLPSGSMEERSGYILTWYHSTGDFDGPGEAARITEQIAREGIEDVAVRATEDNRVSLEIRNLRFVADQAVLLPGEEDRLDGIAEVLASVPDRSIMVIGHTADVGTAISQLELSYQRARKIVDELTARGIEAGRLFYDGRGGREPVAPNDTDEGRARNRRVEIEILPARN